MKKTIRIKTFSILFLCFIPCLCLASNIIDNRLKMAMKIYKVPVVGYAIINNYKVAAVKTITLNSQIAVSRKSLFQAASISKSMAAYATLMLVDQGKIKLNKPANHYLKHWKIPDNKFTKNHPVLIKNLMDMTSGLSVSGFAGYSKGEKLPSKLELLNGSRPANNQRIEVFYTPGSKYFYSGGAFQVLEQVIADVTDQDYNQFMNTKVLPKIGMNNSIYQYPLKEEKFLKHAVSGYDGWSGKRIQGGWHNYACSGAGGLWSTPIDLAKFALNITASYLGKPTGLISKKLAHEMLTRKNNTDFGFGVVVAGKGENIYFWKAGHNYGYHSLLIMFPNQGKGLAIMTNSETGDTVINYITAIIAHEYRWPYYFPFFDELIEVPNY